MEDNKNDIYKSLLTFSKASSEALKALNLQALSMYTGEESLKAVIPLTARIGENYLSGVSNSLSKTLSEMMISYAKLFAANSLSDRIIPSLVSLHMDSLMAMNNSFQSNMIKALTASFATADYRKTIAILNETISLPTMKASDVAFLKTSGLVAAIGTDLNTPKGLATSLRDLNKATAGDISLNGSLEYSTRDSVFKSKSGEADSRVLNVICAGKSILTQHEKEIVDENELIDFCSLLSGTPMLAMMDDTAKKIYAFIKTLFESEENTIDFDKSIYFHCRARKADQMAYTFEEMLKAPYGLPWTGRYNHTGRSNYYFADTQKGAETEVKKHLTGNDVLQTVKLMPARNVRLLDLSDTLRRGKTFLRYLRFDLSDVTNKTPKEYLIPCFVADCCKRIGFDGIKYMGSKEYSNYVVWNDGYFVFKGMCLD